METAVSMVGMKMKAMTIGTRNPSVMKAGKCPWVEWMTIATSFKIQDHAQKGIVSFCVDLHTSYPKYGSDLDEHRP